MTLLISLTLIACTPQDSSNLPDSLDTAYQTLSIDDTMTTTTLPEKINGISITWYANIDGVLNGNKITSKTTDQQVTLTALLTDGTKTLTKTFTITLLKDTTDIEEQIASAIAHLKSILESNSLITSDLELLDEYQSVHLTYSSDNPQYLANDGTVTRPNSEVGNVSVTLTITAELAGISHNFTELFTILAKEEIPDLSDNVIEIRNLITSGTENGVSENLYFPTSYDNVTISYISDNPNYITDDGIITRPDSTTGDVDVTVTVGLSKGDLTDSFVVTFTVLALSPSIYTGYYEGADGLMGDDLRHFLHDLIDNQTVLTYTQLWEALAYTDEDPNNPDDVILIYSQISMDADNHGGDSNEWNREHVWPRSHGELDTFAANTDLHHIRPSLVPVNGTRGNLDFDEGGTLVPNTTDAYKDNDSFEPPDDVKGDIARMVFYMAIRYEGDISNEADLELNDSVNNSGPYLGRLTILLQWNEEDPPDAFELRRNDRIYELQGNRNPFIDHPEFAEYIFDPS
jgi:endonuclease I